MRGDDSLGPLEHLYTEPVSQALDRSTYGDWRRIANADAVSLSFGFPFPASFPTARLEEAVSGVLREEAASALQYGGGEYAARLESYVFDREVDRGIDPETADVTITNGATHAIDSICRTMLSPGDVVVVEQPTFMGVLSVFRNFGVELVGAPVDGDGLDVDALAEILADRRERGQPAPTMLYTIPNFQNPTGTTLPRARRETLLDLAAEYDFAVLEDDAYGDLRYDGEAEPPLGALDEGGRVVRVGTFAKTIAPGVRLGWLSAHESVVDAVDAVAAGGSATFTRSVVGYYCERGYLDESLPELRTAYARRRDRLLDRLDERMPAEATWTEPDGGFFVWLELPEGVDTDAMLEPAIEAGVTYLPGSMFYPDGDGENACRLSFSFVSPDEIDEGIDALARTVRAHR